MNSYVTGTPAKPLFYAMAQVLAFHYSFSNPESILCILKLTNLISVTCRATIKESVYSHLKLSMRKFHIDIDL